MTTKEFIRRCATGEQSRAKEVSSVFFDGKTVYSYGYHYPLLFRAGDAWIVNRRGYSVTTAKHIGIASMYADYWIEIPNHQYRGAHGCLNDLLFIIDENVKDQAATVTKLSPRATKTRAIEEKKLSEFQRTQDYLKSLTEAAFNGK